MGRALLETMSEDPTVVEELTLERSVEFCQEALERCFGADCDHSLPRAWAGSQQSLGIPLAHLLSSFSLSITQKLTRRKLGSNLTKKGRGEGNCLQTTPLERRRKREGFRASWHSIPMESIITPAI